MFEDGQDAPHPGVIVTARAFANAIRATDDPPLLVLLNSCKSAAQIDDLVDQVVPFAIGMADSIDDADAINYAAQFYAAIANGQSVNSAHLAGQVRLKLDGLPICPRWRGHPMSTRQQRSSSNPSTLEEQCLGAKAACHRSAVDPARLRPPRISVLR